MKHATALNTSVDLGVSSSAVDALVAELGQRGIKTSRGDVAEFLVCAAVECDSDKLADELRAWYLAVYAVRENPPDGRRRAIGAATNAPDSRVAHICCAAHIRVCGRAEGPRRGLLLRVGRHRHLRRTEHGAGSRRPDLAPREDMTTLSAKEHRHTALIEREARPEPEREVSAVNGEQPGPAGAYARHEHRSWGIPGEHES